MGWDNSGQQSGYRYYQHDLHGKEREDQGHLERNLDTSYPDTAPEGAINDVGTLTGSVVGNSVAVTLLPRKGDALGNCRIIFNSLGATQEMISGTYHFSVWEELIPEPSASSRGRRRLRFS